jgi:hypothetical protein
MKNILLKKIIFTCFLFVFCQNTDAKTLKIVQDTIREDMSEAEFARNELLQSDYDAIFKAATLSKISFYTFLASALIAPFVTGAAVMIFVLFAAVATFGQWVIYNFTKKYRAMLRVIDDEHPDYEMVKYIVRLSNFFFYITVVPILLVVMTIITLRFIEATDLELQDYAIAGGLAFFLLHTLFFFKEDISDLIKRKK